MNCLAARFVLWMIALVVWPLPLSVIPQSFRIEVLDCRTLDALPPGAPSVEWTERVLLQLEKAGQKEIDPWYRDDLRIAWITTRWTQSGVPEWSWHRDSSPYVAATYQVLRCSPEEVWPRIIAQRKAQMGPCYEQFWGVELPPKKPAGSETVRSLQRELSG